MPFAGFLFRWENRSKSKSAQSVNSTNRMRYRTARAVCGEMRQGSQSSLCLLFLLAGGSCQSANGKLRSFPPSAATQMPTCISPTTLKLWFPNRCVSAARHSTPAVHTTLDTVFQSLQSPAYFVVIPYLTYSIGVLPDACGWLTHVR